MTKPKQKPPTPNEPRIAAAVALNAAHEKISELAMQSAGIGDGLNALNEYLGRIVTEGADIRDAWLRASATEPRADTIQITPDHLKRPQHIAFRLDGLKVLAGDAVESETPNQAITSIHRFLEDLAHETNVLDEELHDLRKDAEKGGAA